MPTRPGESMAMSVQSAIPAPGRTRRVAATWPMRVALLTVAAVWLLGCCWSYREQSAFAAAKGFTFPHLLPLVIDGLAVAMAGVAWAASLDARPAVPARLATLVAVAGSAASNGAWAWIRTGGPSGAGHDRVAVALGVAVPVAANLAFEVLLAELRRQVQRGRGLPAPVAIPQPRLVRVALAPWTTLREWRALVLELTRPTPPPGPHPTGHDFPAPVDTNQLRSAYRVAADRPRTAAVAAPPAEHAVDPPAALAASTEVRTEADPGGLGSDAAEQVPGLPGQSGTTGRSRPPGDATPNRGDSRPGAPTPAPDQRPAASTRPDHEPVGQAKPCPTGNRPRTSAAAAAGDSAVHPSHTNLTVTAAQPAERPSRMLELVPARPTGNRRTSRPDRPDHADRRPDPTAAGSTAAGPPSTPQRDPRIEQLLTLLRAGEELNGPRAARVLDCSDRTGRRLLRLAQELHDQATGRTG